DDPIGRRVSFEPQNPGDPPTWLTVVGVVPNTRHYELERPSRIQAYIPMRQASPMGLSVVVKARPGATAAGVDRLRGAVAELAPGMAVSELRPLGDLVADRLGPGRALRTLTALFATFAVALAALGIFGVLSLAVARRRRELGVRMAVGASPGQTVRWVLGSGLRMAAAGVGAGLLLAAAATRGMRSLVWGVGVADPVTWLGGVALVAGVALLACWVPARRASRLDPTEALRAE
ncbi:MAG: FtsX-like permease family protein, partial [Gemmatimonadetes bacterium]|nr:FtsX-like permease family protein [Gemmatimonadota bacterium]